MPTFQVKAQDHNQKTVILTIEAKSRLEAVRQLRQKRLIPLNIEKKSDNKSFSGGGGDERSSVPKPQKKVIKKKKKSASQINIGGPKKAKPLEIVIFCRQMAIAVSAGLPLRDALEGVVGPMENDTLKLSLEPTIEALHSGVAFSEALNRFNKYKVFSPVFIGLLKVAEETGTMASTLEQLADYLEGLNKMRGDIKSKLSYPIFMISAFIVINVGATFFLFPMFKKNYESLGGKLPALTTFVFDMNTKAIDVAPFFFVLILLLVGAVALYRRGPAGRRVYDSYLLRLPLFGPVLLRIGLSRFCKTLAITARGGVPLVNGLEISSVVVGNKYLEGSLSDVREQVMNGNRFATTLEATGNFPPLVVRMVDVGEDSGQLPEVLEKITDIYESEVANSIGKLLSLVEPMIICLFGIFVTVMVLALYMPIFSMSAG